MRSIVLFIANVFGIAWGLYLHVQFLAPQLLPLSHQARPRANTIHSLLVRLELVNPYVALVGEEPSLCIDVGGHVGWTTAEMASKGHHVAVFEPFEGNLAKLRENTAKFPTQVTVYHGAVTERTGTVTVEGAALGIVQSDKAQGEQGEDSHMRGTSSVAHAGAYGCKLGNANCVNSFSLDNIFPTEEILFLKIDVQGGELAVLKGAYSMLRSQRVRYIFLEFTGEMKIITLLESCGYMCFDTPALVRSDSVHELLRGQLSSPGKALTTTTGFNWREYFFKNRQSDTIGWWHDMQSLEWVQTDLLCVRDRDVLSV